MIAICFIRLQPPIGKASVFVFSIFDFYASFILIVVKYPHSHTIEPEEYVQNVGSIDDFNKSKESCGSFHTPPLRNGGIRSEIASDPRQNFLLRRGSGSKTATFEISQIAQKLLKMKVFDKFDSRSPSQNLKKSPKRTQKFKKCENV